MRSKESLDELFKKSFMFNPCPMAISDIDDGKYVAVNDALLYTLGYDKEDVIGKTSLELGIMDSGDRKKAIQLIKSLGRLRDFEILIRCKNNKPIHGVFNAEFITIQGQPYLLSVMTDITVKRQLEQDFIYLEKLNLISQMSAGISHEIRNPMTTVRGFLQFFMQKPAYAYHRNYFELMISELDRVNAIISDFLSITTSDPLNSAYTLQDLQELLEQLRPVIEANALEKRNRMLYCLANTPKIMINEKEIQQMILNLVRNGFDAMPVGGTLIIKTFLLENHVVLAIQDQGKGIDKMILQKLGTPFLTTKDYGTGLGLAVCYGIAHRHKAKINVATSPQGTTFEVHFPPAQSDK